MRRYAAPALALLALAGADAAAAPAPDGSTALAADGPTALAPDGSTAVAADGPATGQPAQRWRPDVRGARAYARTRDGTVAFAVRTPKQLYGFRSRLVTSSASVVKAMLMVTYLNSESVRRRAIWPADRALVVPMVTRSNNRTASRVRDIVGNGALRHLARRVGMRAFATAASWGLTQITAADQTKLFLHIDRYLAPRHRAFGLRLLGSIVPRQRWGIARVRPPGWALYFKGGWVRGIEHQVALLRRGRRRVSIAVLTSGTRARYGRETEREVARRLLRGLGPDSIPR